MCGLDVLTVLLLLPTRYTTGEIAKKYDAKMYRYNPLDDRYEGFSVSIGNNSCSYITLPWVTYCENMSTYPLSDYRIDNVGDWRMGASNLKLIRISSTGDCTTFHNFVTIKNCFFFQQNSFPCDAKENRRTAMQISLCGGVELGH